MVMIHGVHMAIPKMLIFSEDHPEIQKESKWKYFLGILLPILGIGIGMVIAGIIAEMFQLTFV